MALADPLKFKEESGTEVEAPRIAVGDRSSRYSTSDGLSRASVSTTETSKSRLRHLVRLDTSKLTTDIYDESKKQAVDMSAYLVVDRPVNGFTTEEAKKLVEGLTGLLSASSHSVVAKVLGGES